MLQWPQLHEVSQETSRCLLLFGVVPSQSSPIAGLEADQDAERLQHGNKESDSLREDPRLGSDESAIA